MTIEKVAVEVYTLAKHILAVYGLLIILSVVWGLL